MFCKIKNPGFNTKLFILLWLVVIILSFSKTVSAKNYARLYSIRFNNTSMLYGHSLFFHMPGEDGVLDTDDDKSVLINGGASYNSDKMNIDEFLNAYPWHGGNLGDADKKKIDFYIADGASTDECWGAHLVFGADLMDYDVDYAYENCDMTLVESTAYDTIKDDITDQGASWYTFDGGDILSPPSVATVGPGWDPNIYCKVLSAKKALPTGEADEDDNEWHAIFKVWVSSWMNPEACSWTFGGDSYDEQQGWVEDNDLTNAYASASTDAADTTIAWLHHQGAATNGSNSVSWFDLLKPKTIIQQDGGSSKHPYEGALENAANSPNSPEIWRQDMDGTVSISMDSEGNYNISREYDNPDNPFPSGAWTDGYPPPITSISGLVLDSQTSNSISLSWTDPDENVLYFVWRSTYDGGDYNAGISTQPHMSEGTGIYENITGTSPVSGPSYTDSGMDPGIYYYRISGIWDYDKSLQRYPYERKYSNQVEGRTGLVAPSDFIANAISSNTIQWNWQDNSGDEEGFALYSSSGNILISSTTLTANTTYWLQTTLSANTSSYISSIKSLNFIGESSEVTISTFPIFTLSRTPASLNVLSTDVLSLDLSWSSNNNPQWTRYGIASSTDNFAVNISTLITFNDNLNISSTTISNLLPATTYYFKVWAFNENGLQTGFSNIVSTKTNSPNFSVVINEIAWGGTAGTNGSYDEWIELYNNTNAAIDLTGWELFLGPNNADDPNVQLEPLVGTIGAYSYYLVERGTDDNNVSDILADTTGGWGSSGLLNTGEHLQLRNASAEVIDNIDCSAGWFAGSASPNYFSMERKNTNTSGNISSNWASNNGVTINGLDVDSNPLNGTPKAANSANTIDTIAPGNIQNLTAIAHSSLEGAIVLNWTAPGDDSYSGIASSYEIKVSSIANIDDETDYLAASDLSNFSSSPLISPLISASTQTMTITGLTDGASYYFAIKAIDNVSLKGGWSRTSINQNNFTIAFDSAPASPSALTGLTSNEQLTLSWAEPSPFPDDFNNYRIWCDSTSPHDWADKFIYDLSSSTSYITNIHAGTSYYFRVTAIDDAPTIIESSASNEIVVMLNIPIEPENFQGDIVSSTTINWSWSDMSSNESGFAIFSSSGAVIVSSSTLTQNTTFWIQDSLSPNTTSFAHHIKAINSFGSSPPADLSSYPIFSASNPPLSFKIDELSPTSINISWSANNNPATTKYGLSIAKDSSFTVDLSTEIDYSDNFTSTFTSISDLSSGTSYWLRLWSYNDNAVSSSFSNILSTQTVSAEIGIICWLKGGELAANEAKNCLDNYGYATVVSSYVPTRTVLDNYDFVFYFQGSGFSVPDAKGGEQFQDYMQNGKGKLFISGEDWMYDWYSVTDFKNYLHDDASRGDACTAGNVFSKAVTDNINHFILQNTQLASGTTWFTKLGGYGDYVGVEPSASPAGTYKTLIEDGSGNAYFYSWKDTGTKRLVANLISFYFSSSGYSISNTLSEREQLIKNIADWLCSAADNEAPAAISNLTALTGSGEGEIVLTWTAPGDNGNVGTATSYEIKCSSVNNISDISDFNNAEDLDSFSNSSIPIPQSAGTTESFTVTGLFPETTYYFALQAIDEEGNSGTWSAVGVNQANFDQAEDLQPPPPSGLSIVSVNSTQISLTWIAPDPLPVDMDYYEIECDSSSTVLWDNSFIASTTTATTFLHQGLSFDNTYFYRVRSVDLGANVLKSTYSNIVSSHTVIGIPLKPLAFSGTAISSCSINWSWIDNSSDEDGFELMSSSGTIIISSTTLTQNTTFWIQTDLSANTSSYVKYIRALNDSGKSTSTAAANYPLFTLSNQPQSLTIVETDQNSVQLVWNNNQNPSHTRYGVSVAQDSGFSVGLSTVADFSADLRSSYTVVSDLLSAATYWFRIWAYNEDEQLSAFSNSPSTTTNTALTAIICWQSGGQSAANEAKNCLNNNNYSAIISTFVPSQSILDNYDFVFYFKGKGYGTLDSNGGVQLRDYMQLGKGKLFISGDEWMFDWNSVTDFKKYFHDDGSGQDDQITGVLTTNAVSGTTDHFLLQGTQLASGNTWTGYTHNYGDFVGLEPGDSPAGTYQKLLEDANGDAYAFCWDSSADSKKLLASMISFYDVSSPTFSVSNLQSEREQFIKNIADWLNLEEDAISPASISNLTALTGDSAGSIKLAWTAPGDDNMSGGSVEKYLVKYATFQITASDFNNINVSTYSAADTWIPVGSGETETGRVVSGLNPGTSYYFAIKSRDEAYNWSIWSEIPYSANSNMAMAKANLNNYADHIVISEIGEDYKGETAADWLELYNPTNQVIDLSGCSVQRGTADLGTITKVDLSTSIPAYGFYLIGDSGATTYDIMPDDTDTDWVISDDNWLAFVNDQNNIVSKDDVNVVDFVGLGTNLNFEGAASVDILPDRSLERIASSGNSKTDLEAGGQKEIFGNAWDTDNNSTDFIIHDIHYQGGLQNRQSPHEIYAAPVISSFTPVTASVIDQINIYGNYFGDVRVSSNVASHIYFYNDIEVTDYISWSDTHLVVEVPSGAETGKIWICTQDDYVAHTATSTLNFTIVDNMAPAAISNLTALASSSVEGSVSLAWTAPGDDGNIGTASNYIIKASTLSNIGSSSFSSAPLISVFSTSPSTTPLVAGTAQLMDVTGLTPGVTYWFAIKAEDEGAKISSWSTSTVNSQNYAIAYDTVPVSPIGFSALSLSSSSIALSWSANTEMDFKNYELNYSSFSEVAGWILLISTDSLSYNHLGLLTGNTYYYRIRANDNQNNNSIWSSVVSTATAEIAPLAATSFTGTAVSTISINWQWIDNANNEDGYRICNSTDGIIHTLTENTTYWLETELSVNTSYYRYAEAYNITGSSSSLSSNIWTLAQTPSAFSSTLVSSNSVSLAWSVNGNPAYTHYALASSTDNFQLNISTFVDYGSNLISSTTVVNSLEADTSYYFRLWAYNESQQATDIVLASTVTLPSSPLAATSFTGTAVSTISINWQWIDNANNEDGYRIRNSTDGIIHTLTEDTTYWLETELFVNTSYYRYAEAYNSVGTSTSASNIKFTLSNPAGGISFTNVYISSLTFQWTSNNNPSETVWNILRSTDAFVSSTSTLKIYSDGYTSLSYHDSALDQGATYWYKVRSYNGDSIASSFNVAVITVTNMGESLPDVPSEFQGLAQSTYSIKWNWQDNSNSETGFYLKDFSGNTKATLAVNTTYYLEENLLADTSYYRYIEVYNSSGTVSTSAATVYTLSEAVDNFSASASGAHSINLTWQLGNHHSYRLYKSTDNSEWTLLESFVNAANYQDENLRFSTTYYYRIYSLNGDNRISTGVEASARTAMITEEILDSSIPNNISYNSQAGTIEVSVPANTFAGNYYITVNEDPISSPKEIDPALINEANNKDDLDTSKNRIPGSIVEFTLYDLFGVSVKSNFSKTITMKLPYADIDNDGVVDDTDPSMRESGLNIYTLNETTSQWEALSLLNIDTDNNIVSAAVEHFSVFNIMGAASYRSNLEDVYIYPNPFLPGQHSNITFKNLTRQAEIMIFNVAGERVKKFDIPVGTGQAEWDGTNDSGSMLASGVYIYLIKSAGEIKTGKLAIIK